MAMNGEYEKEAQTRRRQDNFYPEGVAVGYDDSHRDNSEDEMMNGRGLPTEAQLVLLCLDYLRDLRRLYPNGEDLTKNEGIHADYLAVAIYALSRSLLEPPPLQFHSQDGNDPHFDRIKANDLTPGLFPRKDPKSSKNWISIPNLTTIHQEILFPSSPSLDDGSASLHDRYQYDDGHPSNSNRFYLLQGLQSGPDLPNALTLGELVSAGLVGLSARSRQEAEEDMIRSPLFDQFVKAVESKGFFLTPPSPSDGHKTSGKIHPEEGSPTAVAVSSKQKEERAAFDERFAKVVEKFRTKLAAKAVQEGDMFGDQQAMEAAERHVLHRQRRRQSFAVHQEQQEIQQSPLPQSSPITKHQEIPELSFAHSTDEFSLGMSVVTNMTKKLAPPSPSLLRQRHATNHLPPHHAAEEEEAERLKEDGNIHMQKKEFEQAIEAYTAALKLSPAGPNTHVYFSNRAAAYLSQRKLDKAILDSERSLAIRPDYAKAHARLGLSYYLKGSYRQAMEAYALSLKYDPENRSSQAYLEKAAKRLAAQKVAVGVETVPSRSGSGFRVADQGQAQSFEDLQQSRNGGKEREADQQKIKGNAHMANRNFTGAFDAYSAAIELSPNGPNSHVYYSNRAAALCYLERYEEAEADSLRSLALDPAYGKAHARLGLSRFFLGDYEKAVEAYTTALRFDPDNAASKSYLNKAMARLKEEKKRSGNNDNRRNAEEGKEPDRSLGRQVRSSSQSVGGR